MSTTLRDLWDDDVTSAAALTPRLILDYQAQQLAVRTKGILRAEVTQTIASDRVDYGFELFAPKLGVRCRLFRVQKLPDREYPILIIPPDPLPEFLRPRVFRPGTGVPGAGVADIVRSMTGHWEDNPWLASSETEFETKLEQVLKSAEVRSTVSSLIAKSTAVNGTQNLPAELSS